MRAEGTKVAASWHPEAVESDAELLDRLLPDLRRLREVGLDPTAIADMVDDLDAFPSLGSVTRRRRTDTRLGTARAIQEVVHEALAMRDSDEGDAQLALMLFRLHPQTRKLSVAAARVFTQERSGVKDRAYREGREGRLLEIAAEAIVELEKLEDAKRWGQVLAVGGDVPETIAMYWLWLFRDNYFRMETSAYALQFDLTTALVKRRNNMDDWTAYLRAAVYWNVEFSYYRDRFFKIHGPLWFGISDQACEQLSDSAERIEYHDPFPEDFIARLRRILVGAEDLAEHLFFETLRAEGIEDLVLTKAADWMDSCRCDDTTTHASKCEVGIVLTHCDLFGQTVEEDFERIQGWYRTERHAADPAIRQLIQDFRTPGNERPT